MSNYRYWECEKEENQNKSVIKLKACNEATETIDEEVEDLKNKLEECKRKEEEYKKEEEKEKEDNKNTETWKKVYAVQGEQKELRKKISSKTQKKLVIIRNRHMVFAVKRLKDIHSRKEYVKVSIMREDTEDGSIICGIGKIRDDIYNLETYGVYLTPSYYDELSKVVEETYYEINAEERKYVENNVPKKVAEEFIKMCSKLISEKKEAYENGRYYDIEVGTFKEWYEDSEFERFSLTSIKQALIIYEYAECNTGRNDYTIKDDKNKAKKVIRLHKNKVDRIDGEETDENK